MVTLLSDDLLVEILTRLPLKSLSWLKCVSKPWQRLISQDCIRGRHPLLISGIFHQPNSSHPQYGAISGTTFTKCNLTDFPFGSSSNSTLVDSSNGLLLFSTCNKLHVFSPITNRWALLPTPHKRALISVLAFDPYRSPHYKVVSFTGWEARGAHLVVFSSQSGKWAEEEVHWDGIPNDAISANMRYFNGALYILAYPRYMVRVDLEKMICRKMELPTSVSHVARVGMLGGQVGFASSQGDGVKIWVLKDDEWVLKHSFTLSCGFNLLGFDPEREVVYVWVGEGKVVGYDMCWSDGGSLDVICAREEAKVRSRKERRSRRRSSRSVRRKNGDRRGDREEGKWIPEQQMPHLGLVRDASRTGPSWHLGQSEMLQPASEMVQRPVRDAFVRGSQRLDLLPAESRGCPVEF